jgi:Flp pilus assembly protein TadD
MLRHVTSIAAAADLLTAGDGTGAEALSREAPMLHADDAGVLGTLALALFRQGRYPEAVEQFRALTRLEPLLPHHRMDLGTALRAAGRFEEALAAYAEAERLGEQSADFWFNVGLTHLDRRDYEAATAVLTRAAHISPQDAEVRYNLAKAHYEALRADEARVSLAGWEEWEGLGTAILANIAQLLTHLGEPVPAESALQRALRDPVLEPEVILTLAQVFERTNRVDASEALLRRLDRHRLTGLVETDRMVATAILAQRKGDHENACGFFRQVLSACDSFDKRHFQLFPLAKSLDALACYAEAFETLREAHSSYRAHLEITAPLVAARGPMPLLLARAGCSAADVSNWDSDGAPTTAESPIFLVGFPRSGTTLLEVALDAHPQLQTMDEQPFLQAALADLEGAGGVYPAGLGQMSQVRLQEVRAKYWQRVQRRVQLAPGRRLLDKNPMNMAALPAIQRLFPNARILLALRHPCDVLMSCYMQHFRAPDFALLCNDLPTLARGHRHAFDYWYQQAQLLAPNYLEVRYESLVGDFAAEMQRILEFLGLPWHEDVLEPARRARHKGFISTPSYSQVVQPVHTSSIGRWRPYADCFGQALSDLRKYLCRWEYTTDDAEPARADQNGGKQ